MKYRRLKLEELELLEEEFVQFLAVNGIDAEMWQVLKSKPTSTNALIDTFSDAWFETYLQKIQFVEYHLPDEIWCFQFNSKDALAIVIQFESNLISSEADDRDISPERLIKEMFYSSKSYSNSEREKQIFDLLEKGGVVTDGVRFKEMALKMAL